MENVGMFYGMAMGLFYGHLIYFMYYLVYFVVIWYISPFLYVVPEKSSNLGDQSYDFRIYNHNASAVVG
jgi:hypothetical protein